MPRKLVIAVALLIVSGPFLVFPDLLPAGLRVAAVTVIAAAALAAALPLLWPWRAIRWGLVIFAASLAAGWLLMPVRDVAATRHFAGVVFGMLAMACVASWCVTEKKLMIAAGVFTLGAIAVLTAGLVGGYLGWSGQKFITGTTEATQTLLYPWIPHAQLGLPGLERTGGWVNSNALGATALLLLPACAGILAAARLAEPRRAALTASASASAAVILAASVIWMSRSRTALLAAALTAIVLALCWRKGRRWVLLALVIGSGAILFLANQTRIAAPDNFEKGMRQVRENAYVRVIVWQDALDLLKQSPVLGAGMSQFHDSPRTGAAFGEGHIAHAHNMFLQVALDIGVVGLIGYLLLFGGLLWLAFRTSATAGVAARVAGGCGLSLVAVHFFGIGDAIALGAKVGLFLWLAGGLILAAAGLTAARAGLRTQA